MKEYGWGKKSKANDFKELKRRLIEFGEMNENILFVRITLKVKMH